MSHSLLVTIAAAGTLASITPGCSRSVIWPAPDSKAQAVRPEVVPLAEAQPGSWTVLRVGGEGVATLHRQPGVTAEGTPATYWSAGSARISAALPDGYPPPTPPGALELKTYPGHRQAIVRGDGSERSAFWPLFQHIKARGIAMTAPVVMTGKMGGGLEGASSMAFLYRRPELGPVGPADDGVAVEDTAEETVLAIGYQGTRPVPAAVRARLTRHLEEAGGRWAPVGPPRVLGYNGPDVSRSARWAELQQPVRWVPRAATP